MAQGVYVFLFLKELWHLVTHAVDFSEQQIMLLVLGLIDVVMISNLLMMVIIGGYETSSPGCSSWPPRSAGVARPRERQRPEDQAGDGDHRHLVDPSDAAKALAKLKDISQYFSPNFIGVDYASSQQLFAAGRAAMFAGGSFEIANFKAQNPTLDVGVFASPVTKSGDERLIASYYDGGYAVNAKSDKKDAALKFVRFLATPEYGTAFTNALKIFRRSRASRSTIR